ncbi:MAG TPA: hypothetical protein VHO91_18290 [Rhodopila sp.]|nr:hypothetical protein [Rhodopila sp.]
MSTIVRAALSAGAVAAYGADNYVLSPLKQLVLGDVAGQQLGSSDNAYLATTYSVDLGHRLGTSGLVLVVVLIAIWWKPIRYWVPFVAVLGVAAPDSAHAYYQKSDYAEPVMIEPNETAFWVPSVGDNENSQTKTDTEDYYQKQKVFRKLFFVPHMHLQGSGTFFDYYVPAGTLIIVDRSMYSREWVSSTERGTSVRDEGFHCQSSEGLNTTVGISIGAEITEDNAARYLSHFKVKNNQGSRSDPNVMFQAVYFSPPLAEVMDNVLRPVIEQYVCKQIMFRTVDDGAKDANVMMDAIHQEVSKYLDGVGIKLDNIGWADTFTYDRSIQAAMNQRYATEKLRSVIDLLQQKAIIDAIQKNGWNGVLPSNVSLTFWPDSWTAAVRNFFHVTTASPAH